MLVDRVLYIHAGRCTVYEWERGAFVEGPTFAEGQDGAAELLALVQQHPDMRTAVLADVVEEEHHREAVPKLRSYDLKAMLKRRLKRSYTRTPYRNGAILKEETGDPKTVYIRLSGITRPEAIRVWTRELETVCCPIIGIYTPAVLSSRLLQAIRQEEAAATLISTKHSDGRVRHTYYEGGCLIGSRRFRDYSGTNVTRAEFIAGQVESTLRHFKTANGPGYTGYTDVVLIGESRLADVSQDVLDAISGCRLRTISMAEVEAKLGVDNVPADDHGEQLFVNELRKRPRDGDFAQPRERRYGTMSIARWRGKVAASVLACALIAYSMVTAWDVYERRNVASFATLQAESMEAAERAQDARLYDTDPLTMRSAVQSYYALQKNGPEPVEYLGVISRGLVGHRNIQVDGIGWAPAQTADPEFMDFGAAEEPATGKTVLTVSGRVLPFNGEYQLAFDQVDSFVSALSRQPGVASAKAIKLPLNVSTNAVLEGEVTSRPAQLKAEFEVEIILEREHETV